jgi:hypothetical protein
MEGTIDDNRLIALLLQQKLLNKRQVKEAMAERERTHKPMDQVLLDLKLVTPAILTELKAEILGLEHIRLSELRLDSGVLKLLPKKYAVEHRAIPISLSGNTLTIAMERPQDVQSVDEIKMLTGFDVRAVVCSPKDIELGLTQYPMDEEFKEVVQGPPPSKAREGIQFTIFMVLLMLPLIMVPLLGKSWPGFTGWLLTGNNMIVGFIFWGFYTLILYYLYSWFVERPPKSK